ncbi:Arc family DNA-binding protein [Pantoea agglomerans pv. betae]|jgi:predicted DNA-binding protein|uniref:Arc family DNA-binding protein n=1 Tax=Enterobacter agglomerans TaxID=549 RepID=UPI0007E5B4CD|nr:Arc family DNA-binding protein [Pantoea agglomerans]WHU82959.1 Arc family DNA-binding protein [Pantoea agglomerans pv. betae]
MARDEPKVNVRLSQELKDQLHLLAEKNKRSVNSEIVAAIESAIETSKEIDTLVSEQRAAADKLIAADVMLDSDGQEKYFNILKKIEARLSSLESKLR